VADVLLCSIPGLRVDTFHFFHQDCQQHAHSYDNNHWFSDKDFSTRISVVCTVNYTETLYSVLTRFYFIFLAVSMSFNDFHNKSHYIHYISQWPLGLKNEPSSLVRNMGSWVLFPLMAYVLILCCPMCR
jgi:hypothetical protein